MCFLSSYAGSIVLLLKSGLKSILRLLPLWRVRQNIAIIALQRGQERQ